MPFPGSAFLALGNDVETVVEAECECWHCSRSDRCAWLRGSTTGTARGMRAKFRAGIARTTLLSKDTGN